MSVAAIRASVPRVLLSKPEAAEAMGMSVRHFERHVQDHVPVVYSGSLRLFAVDDLRAWADREAVTPGRSAT